MRKYIVQYREYEGLSCLYWEHIIKKYLWYCQQDILLLALLDIVTKENESNL